MSSPTNPLPGQMVQGNEDAQFAAFVNQQIEDRFKAYLEEQKKAGNPGGVVAQPAAPQPLKIKLPDGSEQVFNSVEELNTALGQVFTKVQEIVATNQVNQQQIKQEKPVEDVFDKEKFFNMFKEDPAAANDYAMKYSSSYKTMQEELNFHRAQSRAVVADQFRAMFPNFQANPQTASIIDGYRARLGQEWDVNGLKTAYLTAMSEGALPFDPMAFDQLRRLAAQSSQGQPGQGAPSPYQNTQQPGYTTPVIPPALGRGGNDMGPNIEDMANQLPLEELERILTSGGTYPGFSGRR